MYAYLAYSSQVDIYSIEGGYFVYEITNSVSIQNPNLNQIKILGQNHWKLSNGFLCLGLFHVSKKPVKCVMGTTDSPTQRSNRHLFHSIQKDNCLIRKK